MLATSPTLPIDPAGYATLPKEIPDVYDVLNATKKELLEAKTELDSMPQKHAAVAAAAFAAGLLAMHLYMGTRLR